MSTELKKLKKRHKITIGVFVGLAFIFSIFGFFSHRLLEHGLGAIGQENAHIGSVDYGLTGTALRDITLPRLGIHIDEIMLYATAGDFSRAQLTKADIRGLRWQQPPAVTGDEAALPLTADSIRAIFRALNLHSREIEIGNATLRLTDGITLALSGNIYDRGEAYLANFRIKHLTEETGNNTTLTLDATGSAEWSTATGAAKLQLDVAGLDVAADNIVMKRLNGWLTAEAPATGDNLLLSGQLAAGSLRLFDIPLTQTALTLSGDDAKFQALVTARLPAEGKNAGDNTVQAEISVARPADTQNDSITATLAADFSGLHALGIDGLGGTAKIDGKLAATKPRDAGYGDLARYSAMTGTLDIDAEKLSLKQAVQNAEAHARLTLGFDPSQKILHLQQGEKPLQLKMTRDGAVTDIRIAKAEAGYAVDTRTLHVTFANAVATLPQAALKNISGDISILSGAAPVAEGKITFGEIASSASPALFTPLKGELTLHALSSAQYATGIQLNLNGQNGALVVKGDGRYDSKTKDGSFRLRMTPLALQKGVYDLGDFFPVAAKYISEVTGTVAARADGEIKNGKIASRGGLLLKDVGATYADYPVVGINSVLKFDSLFPLSFTRQTLAVGGFTAGLPLQNGVVVMSLDRKGKATLHDGRMSMAGGQVFITPFSIDIARREGDIILNASNLDLGQLFAIAPMEGLSATGSMAGRLPLRLAGGAISLNDGVLESAGDGTIKYNPVELPAFLADQGNPRIADLRVALANFNFAKLRMVLNGDLVKEQRITLNIEGKNPDFYGGHPVKLNLNVEGPLQNIVKYAPGSSNIPDAIEQQIEQFEENNAPAAP